MSQQRAEASCDAAAARALECEAPSTEQRSGSAQEAIGFVESTGGDNLFGTPGQKASSTAKAKFTFQHVLNEYLEGSSMVAGIVPATPVVLATNFFQAYSGEIRRDDGLQAKVTALLGGIPEYDKEVKAGNLAVALVDLSNNKLEPRYAGVNDKENFYAASVAKVCGLLAAYQLKADCNYFLESYQGPADIEAIESALKNWWKPLGVPEELHPAVAKILTLEGGSLTLQKDLLKCFHRISFLDRDGHQNGSTAIERLGFPFVGSTMLAHGLFSPVNKSGLWVNMDYNEEKPKKWESEENPHPFPGTPWHSVNAVSMAQFFTLAAQDRMIDRQTSQFILEHLNVDRKYGGGLVSPELAPDPELIPPLAKSNALIALEDTGFVAAKCGYYPKWPYSEFLHEAVYYKANDGKQEIVMVILTKNRTHGVVQPLFGALLNAFIS